MVCAIEMFQAVEAWRRPAIAANTRKPETNTRHTHFPSTENIHRRRSVHTGMHMHYHICYLEHWCSRSHTQ